MANPTQYIFPVMSRHIENEQLVGLIDGNNVIFQTAGTYISGKISVYLNGLRQRMGVDMDYVELSDTQIEMNNAPLPGDTIHADYLKKSC